MKAKPKVRRPIYEPSDKYLFRLFDPGEMEHVCEMVGLADVSPEALRRLLGRPIAALQARIVESGRGANDAEWDALERFAATVRATAMRLSEPLDSSEAEELARDLRAAWLEAIAYASAYRMYADLPRELEVNKRKTAALVESRKTASAHARGDHERIRADYAEAKAAGERNIAKKLATKYNRSIGGIQNICSKTKV